MKKACAAFWWAVALSLRFGIIALTWARARIKHGPSARLWLASDLDIAAEARRRGLFRRRKRPASANVIQMARVPEPDACEFNANGQLAVKTVMQLQQVPEDRARDAVRKALEKIGYKAKVDEIVVTAIRFVA